MIPCLWEFVYGWSFWRWKSTRNDIHNPFYLYFWNESMRINVGWDLIIHNKTATWIKRLNVDSMLTLTAPEERESVNDRIILQQSLSNHPQLFRYLVPLCKCNSPRISNVIRWLHSSENREFPVLHFIRNCFLLWLKIKTRESQDHQTLHGSVPKHSELHCWFQLSMMHVAKLTTECS